MKIVVFGASRGVGLEVVKQALKAGHTVTAFVRSPEKFTVKDANLTVFKGDSMDAEAVEKAIAGQDAVISALGPTALGCRCSIRASRRAVRIVIWW